MPDNHVSPESDVAVEKTRDAQEAIEKAREAQMEATFLRALQQVFDIEDMSGQRRFLDVSRVPLICQAILGINDKLKNIDDKMVTRDQFWPVKTIVYGIVGIILTAFVAALVLLIVPH